MIKLVMRRNLKKELGCQKNNQRISFTKEFKRRVLLEVSKGRKPEEIFDEVVAKNFCIETNDKKYYAKLMHKWRKEIYTNHNLLSFSFIEPTNKNLELEIDNLSYIQEIDEVETEFFVNNEFE